MKKNSKIYVAGHTGLVGSAIVRNLRSKGYGNIIGKTIDEMDLKDSRAVREYFESEKPEYVILAAAKVGGIIANNTYRADFIYENLQIQNTIIHQSYLSSVKKLLFLGSSCIYPRDCPQPMKEEYLLTSPLEYTNEPYAVAKIAGLKMIESYNIQYETDFIAVMPTNLYGINDNFDLEKSHVLPAMIRKFHLAKLLREGRDDEVVKDLGVETMKEARDFLDKHGVTSESVEIWGTGRPTRELMCSDDMADACIYLLENVSFNDLARLNKVKGEIRNTHINIGTGSDMTITDIVGMAKKNVGFDGEIVFNDSKPDGTMQKRLDVAKLHSLGWHHRIDLPDGIRMLYDWYKNRKQNR